jgi:hypothetical protein
MDIDGTTVASGMTVPGRMTARSLMITNLPCEVSEAPSRGLQEVTRIMTPLADDPETDENFK